MFVEKVESYCNLILKKHLLTPHNSWIDFRREILKITLAKSANRSLGFPANAQKKAHYNSPEFPSVSKVPNLSMTELLTIIQILPVTCVNVAWYNQYFFSLLIIASFLRMFQLVYCVIHIQSYWNIFFEWKFQERKTFSIFYFSLIFCVLPIFISPQNSIKDYFSFYKQKRKKKKKLNICLRYSWLSDFFYHWVFIWKRYLTSNMLLKIIFIVFAKIVFIEFCYKLYSRLNNSNYRILLFIKLWIILHVNLNGWLKTLLQYKVHTLKINLLKIKYWLLYTDNKSFQRIYQQKKNL